MAAHNEIKRDRRKEGTRDVANKHSSWASNSLAEARVLSITLLSTLSTLLIVEALTVWKVRRAGVSFGPEINLQPLQFVVPPLQ